MLSLPPSAAPGLPEGEPERGALLRVPGHPVLDPDVASIARNKHPAYREPKTLAPSPAALPLEPEKDRLLHGIVDTGARVGDGDDDGPLIPDLDRHRDLD